MSNPASPPYHKPLPDSSQKIHNLFRRMSVIYGDRWNARWPNREALNFAMQEWGKHLEQFTAEQINLAVDKCVNPEGKFATFSPTLGEFVGLCKPEKIIIQDEKVCVKCGATNDVAWIRFRDGSGSYYCSMHSLEIHDPERFNMIYGNNDDLDREQT